MVKTHGWLTKIAVLFIFLLNVEVSLVNTALGEISKSFPNADPVLINLVSTMPVIFMFGMALIIGKLATKYDKKKLLIIALVIYIIGGLGGAVLNGSIGILLFTRALVGIGAGMSAPLTGSIVADLYEGNERATMLGWSNAFDSLLAVFITMLGGWLCAINWRYTFLAYGIFIFVLLLEMYALPSLPPSVATVGAVVREKPHYTGKQKLKLALIALYVFCNLMAGMMLFMKMPIMVTQDKLGDPVLIATAFSMNTAGAFISAFLFGFVNKILKRYTLALYSSLTAVVFLIIMNAHSMTVVFVAFFLNGLANGMFVPSIQYKAISTGPKINATYATSIALGAMFFGQFVATFVEKILGIFGDPTPRFMFKFSFTMFVIYTIAYLIWVFLNPKDEKELMAEAKTAAV